MEMKKVQKEVWQNKLDKGFNTTDVNQEFCYLYGEVAEAFDAYRMKKEDLGQELADVAIFLMGISEMLGYDLEHEILNKVEINKRRKYKKENGVFIKVVE